MYDLSMRAKDLSSFKFLLTSKRTALDLNGSKQAKRQTGKTAAKIAIQRIIRNRYTISISDIRVKEPKQ